MKKILLAFFLSIPLSSFAQGTEIRGFSSLWSTFHQKSLKQKSTGLEKEMNQLSLERAERHWLPRAYVTGQWFNSNDPGQIFFQNLGQRAVEQMDFIPKDLNNPERGTFKMMSLGVDFPLFEGGMKVHQANMYAALVKSSDLEMKAKKSEDYTELGKNYSELVVLTQKINELKELKSSLQKLLSAYQVGAKSNPVGYSGLLGLRGVENRVKGLLLQMELKMLSAKEWIEKKTEISGDWIPEMSADLRSFFRENFMSLSQSPYSSMLLSQEEKLKTLDEMREMEKARFLPRVGLFAQENIYQGKRDTANSNAFGIYVQWDLFNSDSFGRVAEANAKAVAEKVKLSHYKQEEKIMLTKLSESKITLEKSLELLHESDLLLKEQSLNAMKLFRSGMLNALQLAEVVNRRADLVENKLEAEMKYIEVNVGLYQLNN